MCLVAIAIDTSARFPWVLLSNRDEFFDRLAAPLDWWQAAPGQARILSGLDLTEGGTWLGLNEAGRLALVTNVREPGRVLPALPSRGHLVPHWLQAAPQPSDLPALAAVPRNGFNLLVADLAAAGRVACSGDTEPPTAWWLSNRPQPRHLAIGPGVVGLSNAALDTPWPKVEQLKQRLRSAVQRASSIADIEAQGFAALGDRSVAADALLPHTGLPLARERQLSAAFIHVRGETPRHDYGTRCSTLVAVECLPSHRQAHVIERSFDRGAMLSGEARFCITLPAH